MKSIVLFRFVSFRIKFVNRMEIIKDSRGFYMTHYDVAPQNAIHCLYSNSMDFFLCMFILFAVNRGPHTHSKRKSKQFLSYKFFFISLEIKWHTLTPHVFKFQNGFDKCQQRNTESLLFDEFQIRCDLDTYCV